MVGNQASYEDKKKALAEQCYSGYEALKSYYVNFKILRTIEAFCPSLAELPFSEGILDPDDLREEAEKASNFLHVTSTTLCFRRFCVTEEGRMAIVRPKTLPGDVVCIIKGARMPYVLRKVKESTFLTEGQ
jgi:hypothetical protein